MEPCERCSCTGTEVAAGEQLPQPLPRVLDRSETPVRLREQLSACPQGPLSPSSSQNCWQLLIAPCLEFTFPIGRTVSDLSCRDGIGGGDQQSALRLSGGADRACCPCGCHFGATVSLEGAGRRVLVAVWGLRAPNMLRAPNQSTRPRSK